MGILDFFKRSKTFSVSTGKGITPPPRTARLDEPLSLPAVYRAVQVIANGISQLPLYAEKNGKRLTPSQTPGILKTPDLSISRDEFIEQLVLSLALRGNAYWLAIGEYRGAPAELRAIHPDLVTVTWDKTRTRRVYSINGKQVEPGKMGHAALSRMPGMLTGIGPITAARRDLEGAAAIRDYATDYFASSGQPAGILSTEQPLNKAEAKDILSVWNYLDENGDPLDMAANPSRVRVLPKGIKYTPILISPKDAQWLEARAFTTTEIARLFGVPAGLLLAAVDGNSQTYSNIEQAWIEFSRFTLTGYTRKIEGELTRMLPAGMQAKFNYEGLLRADTKTRYESYQIAINCGLLTRNECRALDGLEPLDNQENQTETEEQENVNE